MQGMQAPQCLHEGDFSSYLEGSAKASHKTRIEKHLNVCVNCFEEFLFAFNRHLDESGGAKVKSAARRGAGEEVKRNVRL